MKEKKETTTTNKIADSIRYDINYSKLKPGTKLIEREIAEQYKASHIPVREALRILEGEGYVEHIKFAGYVVREITPDEMVELYDIIRFLSNQLLSTAIPRYSQITYYQLESLTEELSKTKEVDQRIPILIQFIGTAFAPAQLNYSHTLAMQILHRNISVFQVLLKDVYYKGLPEEFQRNFITACQTKGAEAGIKSWNEKFDDLAKGLIALLSGKRIQEKERKNS
jgi:DNA-binding GntR family transcriptional regulator